jgi:heme-degrading monooxygenase HmoA
VLVVKATIAADREDEFNRWYDTVRAREIAGVPGFVAMRRYAPVAAETAHRGTEPWQYVVVYEFASEAHLRAFLASPTLQAMTRDYDTRFGGAGDRIRLTYRQVYP